MGYTGGINWTYHLPRLIELKAMGYSDTETAQKLSDELNVPISSKAVELARTRNKVNDYLMEQDLEVPIYDFSSLPDDEDYMISCDYHAPNHSEEYINKLLLVAAKFGVRKHIIIGDLFDMESIKFWKDGSSTTLDDEIKSTKPVIKALDYFDLNYLIMGNHENRPGRQTDYKIRIKHLYHLFGKEIWEKKFRTTPYDKMGIGDDWLLIHPKSYSQCSASVAVKMAEKVHRHVLNAHGHFIAMRYDRSGKYMAIDMGGMFDRKKIRYINMSSTTHPVWNSGFGMFRNKHFHHFHDGTDWDFWTGENNGKYGY